MLKKLIRITLNNMNNNRKEAKQTLAKKLSGKKVPKKLQQNVEVAEEKSKLFGEQKNKKNIDKKQDVLKLEAGTSNKSNVKSELVSVGTSNKSNVKSELAKNEMLHNKDDPIEIKTKRSTRKKVETEAGKSLEILNVKPEKITKTSTKKKIPILEEPCSSKKLKEEEVQQADKWEPANWKLVLENIRTMRSNDKAPVDTMGCHKCADENADEKTQRFHKLVALMLSSQTKDETTYHAMLRLREHNLTPEVICDMKGNVLENILHPVSFYKNKAKYLQQTSKILMEKYNSDIPNNIKELVALPGVGPKMAHICMSTAWHEVTGIGVDVHVHRISNRLGWLPKSTKEPEQTRVALESWVPQDLWSDVNHLLVGFGQTVCTPVKPKCSECLNSQICPSAPKTIKNDKTASTKVLELCDKTKFKKTKMHL